MDRSGNITISFLTVYGDRMADTVVSIDPAHMVFSSPLSAADIGGAKVAVTIPPPTIGLTAGAGLFIEAYETEIHPPPASFSFSSNPKWAGPLMGVITLDPGVWGAFPFLGFSLNTKNYEISASTTNMVCPVPIIGFESSTGLSIGGHTTIITSVPAKLSFKGGKGIEIGFGNVRETNFILYETPPVFNFKKDDTGSIEDWHKRSLAIPSANVGFSTPTPWVYFPDAFLEAAMPFFKMEGDLSFQSGYEVLDASLPSLAILIGGGAHLSEELPSISLVSSLSYNLPSELVAAIPVLSFEAYSGSGIKGELPLVPTFSSLVTVSIEDAFVGQLPRFSASGVLSINSHGDLVATIPSFRNDMLALTGETANLLLKHPFLHLSSQAVTGEIGQVVGCLPRMQAKITSIITGPAHISMTMKPMGMVAAGKGLSTEIQRYRKDRIR